jgi:cbb3-type cytochrome oxidase maturation protein
VEVIFIVLPLALLLAGMAVTAFLWAVRRGQYDDLDAPPCRVLFEDDSGDGTGGGCAERSAPAGHRRISYPPTNPPAR